MATSELQKKLVPFVIVISIISFILLCIPFIEPPLKEYVASFMGATEHQMGETAISLFENIFRIVKIILWMTLIISIIRLINYLIFGAALRNSNTYELSGLIRNVISIIL